MPDWAFDEQSNPWRHAIVQPSQRRSSEIRPAGLGSAIDKDGATPWAVELFQLSLRLDGCAIPMDSGTDCLHGTLTETLGIALADLRQHDNALGQGRPNGVVAARSSAERGPAPSRTQTHLTDCFAVKVVAVEVRSDGHGKAEKD